MLAELPYHDLVPPSDVNVCTFVFVCTGRPLTSHTARASFCNTLLCRHMYLPWLRATLQELRICSVVCLPWHSRHLGSSFIPYSTRFAFRAEGHIQQRSGS
ncbi:hypothetical protein PoB_006483300 [Plakobranchus ocellatus]|uniref:Uncharacterized protein n=1 Tax=Plakobranchus ocellatus TaxID=259542 RepID=A0AAV4D2F6_9GAST|nr:hypothetical protein PoB_006483300 [Plakobranchus ocellatus]